jgi:Bacterial Ig-like domain (group 3)/FG-GAP-like repeat
MSVAEIFVELSSPVHPRKILVCWAILSFAILCFPSSAQAQRESTFTTLTVSPSLASAGQVVTLTATVSNGDLVTSGTVTFLSGTKVLGTVQLVASGQAMGTATLKTRFAPGTYTLTAGFNGTIFNLPSQSQPQQLSVTGTEPTITTLTAQPDGNNYDFTDSVFGFGFPPPTGSATVNDLTLGGFLLGNIGLAAPGQSSFLGGTNFAAGASPYLLTTGDFNGDGIPDLAVSNGDISGQTVNVLLGNGDGTFQAPHPYQVLEGPLGIASGDFNADGNLDLAVACFQPGNQGVSVLLGNGDGSFQAQQPYPIGVEPIAVAVGDFNSDGAPDLAVVDFAGSLIVLLNNGDGTFTPERQTFPAGTEPMAIVVGDFNGDGNLDVAVVGHFSQVQVLLGNGDGTFQPAKAYDTGRFPFGIAVGDLNGDGILDLAVTNLMDSSVSVLLGNGDGSFTTLPPIDIGVPIGPAGIVIADFNGDGVPDLAVSTGISNGDTVTVLLGNGDGTFQQLHRYPLPVGGDPIGLVTADFNGDGVPDLAAANFTQSAVAIFLGGTVTIGQLTNTPVPGSGNQNIQSTYTPNTNFYTGSVSNIVPVTGNGQIPTTTTVTSSLNPSSYLQPVTFTATVTGRGGGSPTGTVTFTADQNVICAAVPLVPMQNRSTATCLVATLGAGQHNIVAGYSGDSNFAASQSPGLLQVVNRSDTATLVTSAPNPSQVNQTVTITAVVSGHFGGTPTGTVDFTDNGAPLCSGIPLDGSGRATCQTRTLAVGTHQLGAVYNGDGNFNPSRGATAQTVISAATATTTQLISSLNPSDVTQPVTFTATVTALDRLPTGYVTFTSNGQPIPECPAPVPVTQVGNSGVASCTTQSLPPGADTILAAFNDPQGLFSPSSATLAQMVQGFSLLSISPAMVTVIQGFNNTNEPFFSQAINLTVQPLFGYGGTVTLSCSVNPTLVDGTCMVNPPSSGSLGGGNFNTTLTIGAGSSTPIGSYTVTVTAQDPSGLMRFATLALTVIEHTQEIKMPAGGGGRTPVSFPGPPGTPIGSLSCPSVAGTGITGSEDLSKIGGVCTFNPGSVNLPGPVIVTISGCTVAGLRTRTQILAAFWLGMPAMLLLGSLRRRRLSRKGMFHLAATLLLILAFLMGVGCGGGYGRLTPTGFYSVLVQGTGPDGTVYSAVVPVTVTPLGN